LGDDTLERLDYSLGMWRALEQESGQQLFIKTGLLNFGPPGDAYLEKYMAILEAGARPYEWLNPLDIRDRFPTLRYPEEWGATWDPNGGLLVAHSCLTSVQLRFRKTGGHFISATVESIEEKSAGVEIGLRNSGSWALHKQEFDQIIVCAGPWTGKLLPALEPNLRPVAVPVTYWRDKTGSCSASRRFPILFNARLSGVYAIPAYEYPDLVKVLYPDGPEVDPDARDLASLQHIIDEVGDYVREHLPDVDHRKPAILEACMYTMTPDHDPIIDRISSRVVVGCGFSGSGFKHAPATGQMLAAIATGSEGDLPVGYLLERYAHERFAD